MENTELDVALEELENRLERLRALYEQYFMGIERIEPAIPRKDIDRRIYVLRREKVRNTAKRFKLQTIISRYNTFQQYWQRICREIEQGTYKRHVIRAERIAPGKLLTIAARKRLGRRVLDEAAADSTARPAPDRVSTAPPGARAPSVPAPASSVPAPPSVPRPAPSLSAPRPKVAPPPKPMPPPKPGARPAKPLAPPSAAPAPRPFENLNLDMDFMDDWDPALTASKGPAPLAQPFGLALPRPLGAAARVGVPAAAPAPRVAANLGTEHSAPRLALGKPVGPAAGPAASPFAAAPRPPPVSAGKLEGSGATRADLAPPKKLGAAPIARPVAPTPGLASGSLSDDRVRELHARLVEAKRQTQDRAAVSVEGLAKSLKATEAKLREQHKNRKIDFDVVIKDGKAVLKPIVR